jgi:predicted transcriptional regulator
MSRKTSSVLTIRVPAALERDLARLARRRRQTRSEVARELLEASVAGTRAPDPRVEARRQSRLVASHESEQDALEFIAHSADLRGWK